MKNLIITLLLVFNICAFGQTKYKKGIYLTFEEIIQNNPSADYNVELEKRTETEIKKNEGNDYKLNPLDKSIDRGLLEKRVYAYSDGDNLYLNSTKLQLNKWYVKVLSDKKYFIFKGSFPHNYTEYGINFDLLPYMFGGLGGELGGGLCPKNIIKFRFPYIMEKSTKKITFVSKNNIDKILSTNKELLDRYKQNPNKQKIDTILRYLIEWNEKQ